MKSKFGDKQRLLHILDAIGEIEKYTSNSSFEEFQENSMMRFAVAKQLEIIGEASNLLSAETKSKSDKTEWEQIIGMRHVLVHEYFDIDFTVVWQVVSIDLPVFKMKVTSLVKKLS